MVNSLLTFTSPLKKNQSKLYLSLPWIIFLNIFGFIVSYYHLHNTHWLLISFMLVFFINCIGLWFKESRLICLIMIGTLLLSNYNYLILKIFPPKISSNLQDFEIIGEVTKVTETKIYISNISLIGNVKIYAAAEATIEFAKADSFLTYRFIINDKYRFTNILPVAEQYGQLNFKLLPQSEFLNITRINQNFNRPKIANYLDANIQLYLTGEAKDVVSKMVLGRMGRISKTLNEKFTTTGTYHLLSISALHLVQIFLLCRLLIIPLLGLLRFKTLLKYKSSVWFYYLPNILALIICAYYLSLIDYPLPATRALIFLIFWLTSEILLPYIPSVLKFMIITSVMLNIKPWLVGSISFWLSFIATFALIIAYNFLAGTIPYKKGMLFKVKIYFFMILSSSIVIGLFSLPLMIIYFQQFNVLQPFSNLLHIPFVSLLIIPFSFIMLPLLSISKLTHGAIDVIVQVYFNILQILLDSWLYILDINYRLVKFAKIELKINNNVAEFAWGFALLLLMISILISYYTKILKIKDAGH